MSKIMNEYLMNRQYSKRHFIMGTGALLGYASLPKMAMASSNLPSLHDFYSHLSHLAVAGHRGAFQTAPENSIAAIQNCIDLGVDLTEIDVRMTADKVPIVFHDRDLTRMIGRNEYVQDMTLKELQSLYLRDKDGGNNPVTQQTIPTLEEVLWFAKGKIYLQLDIKDKSAKDKIPDAIRRTGTGDQVKILLSIKRVTDIPKFLKARDYFGCFVAPYMNFKSARYIPRYLDILSRLGIPNLYAKFNHIGTLLKIQPWLEENSIKLDATTLKSGYSIAGYYDKDAHKNPDAVWGELHRSGAGIIMTDYLQEFTQWRQESGLGK